VRNDRHPPIDWSEMSAKDLSENWFWLAAAFETSFQQNRNYPNMQGKLQ
jgi:hypothetical protein